MPSMMICNSESEKLPDILTAREIAAYLGLGYTKTLLMIRRGQFPAVKIGSTYRIPREPFLAWLNQPGLKDAL